MTFVATELSKAPHEAEVVVLLFFLLYRTKHNYEILIKKIIYQMKMLSSLPKTRVDMSIMLVIVRTNGAAYWAFKQVVFHLINCEILLNC